MNQHADKKRPHHEADESRQPAYSFLNNPLVTLRRKALTLTSTYRRNLVLHLGLVACFFFTGSLSRAVAQATHVFQPAMAVGGTPQVQSIPVTIQTAGTLGPVKVLTQGSPNLDFILSSVGTCATGAGQICNVSVSFSPKFPGLRIGAIVILDAGDGHILASQNISARARVR